MSGDGRHALRPTRLATIVPPGGGDAEPIVAQVAGARLWDLEDPNLYTVRLTPLGTATWRTLEERTGFRDVTVSGPDVLLNGRIVEGLHGSNRHADYPGLGRTHPDGLARREIRALHGLCRAASSDAVVQPRRRLRRPGARSSDRRGNRQLLACRRARCDAVNRSDG